MNGASHCSSACVAFAGIGEINLRIFFLKITFDAMIFATSRFPCLNIFIISIKPF